MWKYLSKNDTDANANQDEDESAILINDIDVGQLPQPQQKTALNLLLNEETDNVVLELKRKSSWNISENHINSDDGVEVNKKMCFLKIQHNVTHFSPDSTSELAFGSNIVMNLLLPTSQTLQEYIAKSTQTDDLAFYVNEQLRSIQEDTERLIEQEHNLFEQSLAPEIDIEEITLRKSDSNERLGLTVCYNNGEEYADGGECGIIGGEIYSEATVAEVYISDIHPDSVAGRDGRLRQGDQILQINGKDIKTRSETETLIAENNNAVTLLISRYLYADEDDFNDPSTNEDDDEVLVVEDDEDDDDDDEFYEENNLSYVNCMMNRDCCINDTDELNKALMTQVEQQQEKLLQTAEKCFYKNSTSTALTNTVYQSNSLRYLHDGQKEKGSKNEQKICLINTLMKGENNTNPVAVHSVATSASGGKANDDYESEHIYETIPEDPESEPFYCSPYDSSVYVTAIASCSSSTATDDLQQLQQKQRVAQWLGIQPLQGVCAATAPRQYTRSSNGCGRSMSHRHKSTTGTVRSALTSLTNGSVECSVTSMALPVHSQLEDQDNSSSAYNTGGSNNSVSPLTLMLNPKSKADTNQTLPCASVNITPNGVTDDALGTQQLNQKTSAHQKNHSPKDKCKITSPKGGTFQFVKTNINANKLAVVDSQPQPNVMERSQCSNKDPNIHRNMLLRQHLFNQTLSQEKTLQPATPPQRHQHYGQKQSDQMQCPQFTAPNLSQYHFVSSQEVNNLSLNNKTPKSSTAAAAVISNNDKKEEETMVWKVKRRPDGTRYIVRRPAKNRIIKERSVRLNVERIRNDITTTEDDTISEIKTGRYWTREERKKHIEKARERRQQQNKANIAYDDTATLCIGDVNNKILNDQRDREKIKHQHHWNFIRQQHKADHIAHQQHYQLQFNSVEVQKLNASLSPHNVDSPTNKSPITSEEVSLKTGNLDQQEVLPTTTTTTSATYVYSEHNQINSALISVTTS